jgi:hypothetical protein
VIGESFDTGKLDALVASLQEYQDAQESVRACFAQNDTSPDYFCRDDIEARQSAANEFGRRLKAFVMDCIAEAEQSKSITGRGPVKGDPRA